MPVQGLAGVLVRSLTPSAVGSLLWASLALEGHVQPSAGYPEDCRLECLTVSGSSASPSEIGCLHSETVCSLRDPVHFRVVYIVSPCVRSGG